GLKQCRAEQIAGGKTIEETANIFLRILEGKGTEAQNNVILANAGMALYCGDHSLGLKGAVEKARESLTSGRAYETFKNLTNSPALATDN
ncbi:MAG: anthranilate phosphoribosyltransferase, partial [Cyclobacteriaceae bacterium]